MLLIGFYFPYDFCRHAGNYHVCGHVFLYHSPAPIMEFSPTVTPGRMIAPAPIHTLRPYADGAGVDVAAVLRLFGVVFGYELHVPGL